MPRRAMRPTPAETLNRIPLWNSQRVHFPTKRLGLRRSAFFALKMIATWAKAESTGVAGLLVVTLATRSLIDAAILPIVPFLPPDLAAAIGVCAYLAANYHAPPTGIARDAEWGRHRSSSNCVACCNRSALDRRRARQYSKQIHLLTQFEQNATILRSRQWCLPFPTAAHLLRSR